MTKEQAKHMAEVMQAYADGREIQIRDCDGRWQGLTITNPNFDSSPDHYRIAPAYNVRPWKPNEVPVGAQIRAKVCPVDRTIIAGVSTQTIRVLMFWNNALALEELDAFEHSVDAGKTWLPCGVIE